MVLVEGTEKYVLITIVIHLDISAMEDDKGSEDILSCKYLLYSCERVDHVTGSVKCHHVVY